MPFVETIAARAPASRGGAFLLLAAFWLGVGLFAGTASFLADWLAGSPVSWRASLAAPVVAGLCWIPITVLGWAAAARFPVTGDHRARNGALHLLCAVAAGFVLNTLWTLVVVAAGGSLGRPFAAFVVAGSLRWLHVNAAVYLAIVGAGLWVSSRTNVVPLADATPEFEPRRLRVSDRRGTRLIAVDQIDWIEGAGDYSRVHAGTGAEHLADTRMKVLARELADAGFVRIHRSAIVNLERVENLRHVSHGDCEAVLTSGRVLRVSRRRREQLRAALARRAIG